MDKDCSFVNNGLKDFDYQLGSMNPLGVVLLQVQKRGGTILKRLLKWINSKSLLPISKKVLYINGKNKTRPQND